MKILSTFPLALLCLQTWSLLVDDNFFTQSLSEPQLAAHLSRISKRQPLLQQQPVPLSDTPPLGQLPQGKSSPKAPSVPVPEHQQGSLSKSAGHGRSPARSSPTSQPRPQPTLLHVAAKRDAECKNCPYGDCLNAGIIWTGEETKLACWTQGDEYRKDRTWVRNQIGSKPEDFCYMSPYDLTDPPFNYRQLLPYCGSKSELNFYLPIAIMKTDLFTECSLCPYRDCEGLEFFQPGVQLDVNCAVFDGWLQISPSYENGTRKYFRTSDNCYISLSTVHEVISNVSESAIHGSSPNGLRSDRLPLCGPIPHMRLTDRTLFSNPTQVIKSNTALEISGLYQSPKPDPKGSFIPPRYTPTSPQYSHSQPTDVPNRGM